MGLSTIFGFSLAFAIFPMAVSTTPYEFNITAPAPELEKRAFDNARLSVYDINVN